MLCHLLKRASSNRFIIIETALANLLIVLGLWTLQRFLVSGPEGLLSNGYLGIVLRLVSLVNFIPLALSNLLIPFFSRQNPQVTPLVTFKGVFTRSLQILSLWMLVFIASSYLLEPVLNNSFGNFGRELVHDRWAVLLIAFSQLLNSFSSNALLAAQKFRIWIHSDYILSITLLVFVWLFRDAATRLQIVMWAMVLAYGSSALYSLVHLRIYFRNPSRSSESSLDGENL